VSDSHLDLVGFETDRYIFIFWCWTKQQDPSN